MNILDGLDVRVAFAPEFANFIAEYGTKIKEYTTVKNREEDISGRSCEIFSISYFYSAFTVGALIKVEINNTGEASYDYYDAIYDFDNLIYQLSCLGIDFNDILDIFGIVWIDDPTTDDMTRYYGASALTSLNESQIKALSSDEDDKLDKSWTQDCSGGNYIYYAFPASMGVPEFYVGGFRNTAWVESTVTVDGTSYSVFRSTYLQHGSAINLKAVTA